MLLGFQLFITDCNGNTRIMPGDGDAGKKSPVLKKASMTLIFHGISNLWPIFFMELNSFAMLQLEMIGD